ncbi:hypothetical protein PROFUN_02758 [Planoprotostelium fungivorum]|uniref:RhoGEF domain-containing protein n=1 Tax=Planoprotostelium fungivorum TaxID=1890364 RepID=A0A2P6NXH8_9EUKA|nr:hypothetical protein PROFUN_02758 [Planoprotostelium fungivorum]
MSEDTNNANRYGLLSIDQKFATLQEKTGEDTLRAETYGLVSLEDFQRKKEMLALAAAEAEKNKGKSQNTKKTKKIEKNKLSFGDDEEDSSSQKEDEEEDENSRKKRKMLKNPDAHTEFLPDKDREENDKAEREKLIAEWKAEQEKIKNEDMSINYCHYTGSNGEMKNALLKRGWTVSRFLEKAKTDNKDLKGMTSDSLMLIMEDHIVPQYLTFYDLQLLKNQQDKSPVFPALVTGGKYGRIIEKKWYERNKHITPASKWEQLDVSRKDKYYVVNDHRQRPLHPCTREERNLRVHGWFQKALYEVDFSSLHLPASVARRSGIESQHTPLTIISLENRIKEWLEGINNKKLGDVDLESALSDGILLCRTMLVLDNRSIPRYHSGSRATINLTNPDVVRTALALNPVHIRENVSFFIEAVLEYGVPRYRVCFESDITSDRPTTRNHLRVLECLEALAMTAAAKGFPLVLAAGNDDGTLKLSDFNPDELQRAQEILDRAQKKSIGLKATQRETELNKAPVTPSAPPPTTTSQKPEENVSKPPIRPPPVSPRGSPAGGNAQTIEKGILVIQAMIRAKTERRTVIKMRRREAFRDKIAKEILSTEETYNRGLSLLETVYRVPLMDWTEKKKQKKFTPEHVKAIFSDVQIIQGLSSRLLEGLRPRVQSWSPSQCLGDIFLEIGKMLKVYTNYVQTYDQALEYLNEGKREAKNLDLFLEECRMSEKNPSQFPIDSLLILPVQRIPRYDLLLTELIKNTMNDHKDYNNLNTARSQMKEAAEYVNKKKGEFENRAKVLQIQASWEGKAENIVDPTRNFIRMDHVVAWSPTLESDKKVTEYIVAMFNDLLVLSVPGKKPGSMKQQELIRINDVLIKETKLRKWRMKMNENGKLWPTTSTQESTSDSRRSSTKDWMSSVSSVVRTSQSLSSSPSVNSSTNSSLSEYDAATGTMSSMPTPPASASPSVSSMSPTSSSPSFNFNSPGNRLSRGSGIYSPLSSSNRKSMTFSRTNNAEIVNNKGEMKFKICFESPLETASWVADFRSAKEKLDEIKNFQEGESLLMVEGEAEEKTEKALERQRAKVEDTKTEIALSFMTKGLEERKREWRSRSKTIDRSDPTVNENAKRVSAKGSVEE